jgi:hypothetical protein
MLDHHPQLTVANDTHFIPRAIEGIPDGVNPPLDQDLVERVRRYHRFPRLNLPDEVVSHVGSQAGTYAEFVSNLYSAYARLHGKPLAGEKTPDYVRYLPLLHGLFPEARIIHLIRDGRNVALSTLEWARHDKGPGRFQLWHEDPVGVCALWWRWQVTSGRRDGTLLGSDRYYEVRYEDLVHQPERVLQDLSSFLGLPFAAQMLKFYEGKTRTKPGISAKKAWLPPTPGLREWQTQMAARDVELFEALAGDLLNELGYEQGADIISSRLAALAEERQRQWEAEMMQRQARKIQRSKPIKERESGGL